MAIEMLTVIDNFRIDKITEMMEYDSGEILEDYSRSIFIALLKKPGANECKFHWTLSLMNHIAKIIIGILMNTACNEIRPEIQHEQCGFVQYIRTRNDLMIRMLLVIQMPEDLYLCFIDYKKTFDNITNCLK